MPGQGPAKVANAKTSAAEVVVGGQAGGPPAFIRENLVSDFRGVEFKPIEFTLDGLKRSTVIPDVLTFEIGLDARWRLQREAAASVVGEDRNALWPSLRVETCG